MPIGAIFLNEILGRFLWGVGKEGKKARRDSARTEGRVCCAEVGLLGLAEDSQVPSALRVDVSHRLGLKLPLTIHPGGGVGMGMGVGVGAGCSSSGK